MIYRCDKCGAALKYDTASGKLICSYCGSRHNRQGDGVSVEREKLTQKQIKAERKNKKKIQNNAMKKQADDSLYMECHVYKCTSCGAELYINNVEASSFCGYCGQPTIVFNRVSKELMPDCIIPFKVTRDQAIASLEKVHRKSIFAPKEIRSMSFDMIQGVYIPYWICDVECADQRVVRTVINEKTKATRCYYRKSTMSFSGLTMDASRRLIDEAAQRLEPYRLEELEVFSPEYLMGYYADRYDVVQEEAKSIALARAKEFYGSEIMRTVPGIQPEILQKNDYYRLSELKYALLPVWFLTYSYDGDQYTYMVNGQTGKVVGGDPFDRVKAVILYCLLFAPLLVANIGIFSVVKIRGKDLMNTLAGMFMIMAVDCFFAIVGIILYVMMQGQLERCKSRSIFNILKNREGAKKNE